MLKHNKPDRRGRSGCVLVTAAAHGIAINSFKIQQRYHFSLFSLLNQFALWLYKAAVKTAGQHLYHIYENFLTNNFT